MAYSNICDIYNLNNLKSEIEFNNIKLYFKNNQLKNILLNNEEVNNISKFIKSRESYITTINIHNLLRSKNINFDFDSYYKIIIKINNYKNRIKIITENKSVDNIFKKQEICDYMTYFDLVIYESLTEEEDMIAGEGIIDILVYKITLNSIVSYFMEDYVYKYACTSENYYIYFDYDRKYFQSIICKTHFLKEKREKCSNELVKSFIVPIYFDNKRNKGEMLLNYYQPTLHQAVFIIKKIINYNTSEITNITQNYKCNCEVMSHHNKKINKDNKPVLDEEIKICNCFIRKNKVKPFKIDETAIIDKLNLYKYVVFDLKFYYIKYDYDEEEEEEEDDEEDS